MNQILSTQNTKSSKPQETRKSNKTNKANNYQSDKNIMRKAMIVLSILLIIFGLTILIVKVVQIVGSKEKGGKVGELNTPQITIEKKDDSNEVIIKIEYDGEISKVRYWWNDDTSNIKEKNYNAKQFTDNIPKQGENVLHIEVTAVDGSTKKTEKTVTGDLSDLTIEWNQIQESEYLEIIANSLKGIEKIEYYWNDEQPMTVPATEENQKELTTTIPLKRGINELHTVVTDIDGNTQEKTQMLYCVKEPEIDVVISLDQELIIITVSHDQGLKSVNFDINGTKILYDENYPGYDPTLTELTFHKKLQLDSNNKVSIKIDAYSNEIIDTETGETTHATYDRTKDFTDELGEQEQTTEEE